MAYEFSVPCDLDKKQFHLEAGQSIIFVGANGGGKTRLAVLIESELGLKAHRISAHRALNLNPNIAKIGEKQALTGLRVGVADQQYSDNVSIRQGNRWGGINSAVSLLNDYDFLLQALFAEQANTSLKAYYHHKPGAIQTQQPYQITKLDRLNDIWKRLLPHRQLHISGDDIVVSLPDSDKNYPASQMSDGERAIFYMIGQALVADSDSVLIIDEPELHVHRSIMSKLWDEIEAERPDCGFIFITHDLEFAAARAAQKYVIKDYDPAPKWKIEDVPEETGFGDELTALILGSRRPILFVEGSNDSLDVAIYRACYSGWTVVPRSSCMEVIHAVKTMRANASLTWITCSGIVDGDDYDTEDSAYLADLGVVTLPVSEIENVILLPAVSSAIARTEGYNGEDLSDRLHMLADKIFETLDTAAKVERVVVDYCRRRIDRMLKKLDFSGATTINAIGEEFSARTAALNIQEIADQRTQEISHAIEHRDLIRLLAYYDNKGLLALAASVLKGTRLDTFKGWLTRTLRNKSSTELIKALSEVLPTIEAK